MKYTIKTAHWRVPSEDRAFDGWLEGRPTPDERTAVLTSVARERENWAPNSEAWGQLRELERFVGQRVCIQFWDPIMLLLEEEGPYPMLADCQGMALIRREGYLQAYLILDRIEECPNESGYSPAKFLERENKLGCTLAPIAELAEIGDGGLPASQGDNHLSEPAAPRSGESSMALSEYFDSNTLRPGQGRELRCPVKSCTAALQGPHHECPNHGIKVHKNTFVYTDLLRNVCFEREFFERHIRRNRLKAETWRFGYENSEDALTWNVFAALARRRRLAALSQCLSQIDTSDEPELYLWGLRVSLHDPLSPIPFDALCKAREVFERGINNFRTEPDIMMYAPKRYLMLVEAKFMSGNPIADSRKNDVPGMKPTTPVGILNRYRADQLPPGSILTPTAKVPLFSQLYRNLVFAIWMAEKLDVEWRLVSLTSSPLSNKLSDKLATFTNAVLPADMQRRFVRYTWEQLFRITSKEKTISRNSVLICGSNQQIAAERSISSQPRRLIRWQSTSGQRRPDSFASTLKVRRSAVGSGSGRHETARPMSQLGRLETAGRRRAKGRSRCVPLLAVRRGEGRLAEPTAAVRPGAAPRTRQAGLSAWWAMHDPTRGLPSGSGVAPTSSQRGLRASRRSRRSDAQATGTAWDLLYAVEIGSGERGPGGERTEPGRAIGPPLSGVARASAQL
jgi:hypothetical protein